MKNIQKKILLLVLTCFVVHVQTELFAAARGGRSRANKAQRARRVDAAKKPSSPMPSVSANPTSEPTGVVTKEKGDVVAYEDPKTEKKSPVGASAPGHVVREGAGDTAAREVKEARGVTLDYLIALANDIKMPTPILHDPSNTDQVERVVRPTFRHLATHPACKLVYSDLERQLCIFHATMTRELDDEKLWVDKKPTPTFYNSDSTSLTPYFKKLSLPKGSRYLFFADLHGGFHSVMNMFADLRRKKIIDEHFRIIDPLYHIIFAGDLVDRGIFGVEVLYTVLCLFNANPKNVHLMRGNHEELRLNRHQGFLDELKHKFQLTEESSENAAKLLVLQTHISRFYNYLPVFMLLNGHIGICHGGIDYCYTMDKLRAHPSSPTSPMAYELLTPENYNPHKLLSQLSSDCMHGICQSMINQARKAQCPSVLVVTKAISTCMGHYQTLVGNCKLAENLDVKVFDAFKVVYRKFSKQCEDFKTAQKRLSQQMTRNNTREDKTEDKTSDSDEENETPALSTYSASLSERIVALTAMISEYGRTTPAIAPAVTILKNYSEEIGKYVSDNQKMLDDFTELSDDDACDDFITALDKILRTAITQQAVKELCETENMPQALIALLDEFFTGHIGCMPTRCSEIGCVMQDFCPTRKERDILFSASFRYEIGERMAHEIMRLQEIYIIMRGHQHHGDMAEFLEEDRAYVRLWDRCETAGLVPLRKGAIYTMNVLFSAASRVHGARPYDYITVVNVGGDDVTSWSIERIDVPYGPEVHRPPHRPKAGGSGITKEEILAALDRDQKAREREREARAAGSPAPKAPAKTTGAPAPKVPAPAKTVAGPAPKAPAKTDSKDPVAQSSKA